MHNTAFVHVHAYMYGYTCMHIVHVARGSCSGQEEAGGGAEGQEAAADRGRPQDG